MAYEVLEFQLGSGRAQAYVLRGTGEHEGTNETVSHHDLVAWVRRGGDPVWYLDNRFLNAHRERSRPSEILA